MNEEPDELRGRARQNVVWEFGYFVGLVGRRHVAVLVSDPDIEQPTDFEGIAYIPAPTADDQGWRLLLAKEMKAAGLDVDLNNV